MDIVPFNIMKMSFFSLKASEISTISAEFVNK